MLKEPIWSKGLLIECFRGSTDQVKSEMMSWFDNNNLKVFDFQFKVDTRPDQIYGMVIYRVAEKVGAHDA
jgi:hypothetical protein